MMRPRLKAFGKSILLALAGLPLLQEGGCILGDNFLQNVLAAQATTIANQAVASVFDLLIFNLVG